MHTSTYIRAQSSMAVEYTDCISAESKTTSNECPGYDIKSSDGETPVLELWEYEAPLHICYTLVHSDLIGSYLWVK